MKHVYDFYKPDLSSPYPVVDGNLSVQCYMSALDHCYSEYCEKALAKAENSKAQEISLNNFIGVVFHTPFIKLVQKSFARLFLHDALRSASHVDKELVEKFKFAIEHFLFKFKNMFSCFGQTSRSSKFD